METRIRIRCLWQEGLAATSEHSSGIKEEHRKLKTEYYICKIKLGTQEGFTFLRPQLEY